MKSFALSLTLLGLIFTTVSQAAEYKVDPSHSTIGFSVRHLMISKVIGNFKEFEGKFEFDKDKGVLGASDFVVKTASIDTQEPKRDDHLRGPDFFDVAKYPTMTFTKSTLKKAGKDKYKWSGDLTIHGVTLPKTFDLQFLGAATDPMGNKRLGFTASTKISRKEFGLKWNKVLDSGGVAVGDEVTINLDAEVVQQGDVKAEAKAVPAAAPVQKK